LIKYYWFEDAFTEVNTKFTDLIAEDKEYLKGTIRLKAPQWSLVTVGSLAKRCGP